MTLHVKNMSTTILSKERPFFSKESFESHDEWEDAHRDIQDALQNAKGLVFDCDGTLLDTMPQYYQSWKATCDEVGLTLSLERFYSLAGMPVRDIFDLLIKEQEHPPDLTAEYCEELKRQHAKRISSSNKKHAEAIDVVVDIVNHYFGKLPMAVASSGWRDHVLEGLERVGIRDKFHVIVTTDDPLVKKGKPAPDLFLVAAQRLNILPEQCVGFEDADLGLQSLKAAGYMHALDVRTLHMYPRNVEKREQQTQEQSSSSLSNSDVDVSAKETIETAS